MATGANGLGVNSPLDALNFAAVPGCIAAVIGESDDDVGFVGRHCRAVAMPVTRRLRLEKVAIVFRKFGLWVSGVYELKVFTVFGPYRRQILSKM